jgi:hypothetical protein
MWLVIAAGVAAQQPASKSPPSTTPGVIETWLECVECQNGELQAVVKLGQAAVPALARAVVDGPSAAKQQSYEAYLRRVFADLKKREQTRPKSAVPYTEAEFIKRDMDKLVNLYRVRAARALGEIGGGDAAKALDKALNLPLDQYVFRKLREARARIK